LYEFMDSYVGLETEPGSQERLFRILKERQIESYRTLGAHDVICRLSPFSTLGEFRNLIDGILFTTEKDRPLVENVTSYIIVNHFRKKTDKKPTAFCFLRSGRLSLRGEFDRMVAAVLGIPNVLAVSVVIGFFDLVCEVITKDVAELKTALDRILSTPGVSPRATMVCIVVSNPKAKSQGT
jgi:DNA-binding Lrp family transcriptional regulator